MQPNTEAYYRPNKFTPPVEMEKKREGFQDKNLEIAWEPKV